MTSREIASTMGVSYQIVARTVRRVLAERGETTKKGMTGTDYTGDLLEIIKQRVKDRPLWGRTRTTKPSTRQQRVIWSDEWTKRFITAKTPEEQIKTGFILSLIEMSKAPFSLNGRVSGIRTGDHALSVIESVVPFDEPLDAFACWLLDAGFSAP